MVRQCLFFLKTRQQKNPKFLLAFFRQIYTSFYCLLGQACPKACKLWLGNNICCFRSSMWSSIRLLLLNNMLTRKLFHFLGKHHFLEFALQGYPEYLWFLWQLCCSTRREGGIYWPQFEVRKPGKSIECLVKTVISSFTSNSGRRSTNYYVIYSSKARLFRLFRIYKERLKQSLKQK